MSAYILHIDKTQTKALKEIQAILAKIKGELKEVSKSTLEDEYLLTEIGKSSETDTVSFEKGIQFMRTSIRKHGSKI
ncbi:hypothetical protein EMGBS15_04520 [Filimonas sp.]|nr:hypothetical protein EMGBS15_04520 [Filimonas sp.]